MEIIINIVFFILGIITSWGIQHIYYKYSKKDAQESIIASRLDNCNDGDKTFLVALDDCEEPLSLYSRISVDYQLNDGEQNRWSSNTCIMFNSLKAREPFSLEVHQHAQHPNDEIRISLTKRGRENAAFLRKNLVRWAKFVVIEDEDDVRRGLHTHYGFPPGHG